MSLLPEKLGHHSEAVDPTLIEWIKHQIDELIGLDASVIVVLLGSLLVLFPVGLLVLVWLQKRRAAHKEPEQED